MVSILLVLSKQRVVIGENYQQYHKNITDLAANVHSHQNSNQIISEMKSIHDGVFSSQF